MDRLEIVGGKTLKGKVEIGGSKNAALPILISSILSEGQSTFERVPNLEDIRSTIRLLKFIGADAEWNQDSHTVKVSLREPQELIAPYDLVRKMRASVLVLGPMLARFGQAKVSLPGGCAIGARPIDLHLDGLKQMGASIELQDGYVIADGSQLHSAKVNLKFPSVGATENILMAMAGVTGESQIDNAAKEPEIVDLCQALETMGAKIEGAGTNLIKVQGTKTPKPANYKIMGDRVEAGTFLAAGVVTRGDVTVCGIDPSYLTSVTEVFASLGADVSQNESEIRLICKDRPKRLDVETAPFPGFPTDMQAQLMAVATLADGESRIVETIFENRFMHVPELNRMGADIWIKGNEALIRGVKKLKAAPVMATDLRASASLVIAALAAEGKTYVNRIYHLDRGYEALEKKLSALGADVKRSKE